MSRLRIAALLAGLAVAGAAAHAGARTLTVRPGVASI